MPKVELVTQLFVFGKPQIYVSKKKSSELELQNSVPMNVNDFTMNVTKKYGLPFKNSLSVTMHYM